MGKRLTAKAIEALEAKITASGTESRSAVFGICDMQRQVIRRWSVVNGIPEPSDDEPTILIPERLEKLLWPKRRKIVWGGRGSAKTRTIISILTEFARMQTERVVCFREVMKSIADSSYQEVVDEVNRKGHSEDFRVIEAKISVPANGSRFTFDGLLRNQTKIKGYAGATRAWVEEAETVSRTSWDILFPTLRAKGSEIWVSFNPREETDPTWADLVAPHWDDAVDGIYEDDETLIIQCNFEHNPWLTEELAMERDRMARTDPDRYAWIWLGQFRKRSDVKVLNGKWRVEPFEPQSGWDGPYFGADFGFSSDPSTLNKCWVANRKLYIEYEAHDKHVELDDMWHFYAGMEGATDAQKAYAAKRKAEGKKIYDGIPGVRKYKIYGDSARPETISHIAKHGFKIEGVEKWPGSVEDGIAHLRSYDAIIIHPRCKETIAEASAYEYKTDRLTGEVLPDIVDKHNHHWDAIRYALGKIIRRGSQSTIFLKSR